MTAGSDGSAARDDLAGTLLALGAATLWGTSGIFSVVLFRAGVTPLDVALFRPLVATAGLVAWSLAFHRSALWPGRRDVLMLWGVGGAVTAAFQVGYQLATESVGVPATVGMLYLGAPLVMLAGRPLLGETPTRRQVGFGLLAVVGVWGIVSGTRGADIETNAAGLWWGAVTATAYAGYTLFGRWGGRRWPAFTTVMHCYLGATLYLAVALPLLGPVSWPQTPRLQGILFVYGLATVSIAVLLFYEALRRVPASRVAVVGTAEPVVAALLAAIVLEQTLTPTGVGGLIVVVVGVVGASTGIRRRAKPS